MSSFLKDDKVFALILNKKDIKIGVYNEGDGSLFNDIVIDGDNGFDLMAEPPITETRLGKKRKDEDVSDVKKVIKVFANGTEGLTVGTTKTGQFVLQVGTYDIIRMDESARYYKTTYFKLLLDPKTMKPIHGRVPALVGDQVKDYIDDPDTKRIKAARQFALADKQYYGFYDRDRLAYVIEEISIRK